LNPKFLPIAGVSHPEYLIIPAFQSSLLYSSYSSGEITVESQIFGNSAFSPASAIKNSTALLFPDFSSKTFFATSQLLKVSSRALVSFSRLPVVITEKTGFDINSPMKHNAFYHFCMNIQ